MNLQTLMDIENALRDKLIVDSTGDAFKVPAHSTLRIEAVEPAVDTTTATIKVSVLAEDANGEGHIATFTKLKELEDMMVGECSDLCEDCMVFGGTS